MPRMIRTSLALAFAALVLSACGGPDPATPTTAGGPTPADTTPADAKPGAPLAWSDSLPMDQKAAFMKANVLPPMAKVFGEHDAKRYGAADCKTCHGPKFQEPKEFLPHLTFKDGKITSFADKPAVSKWMAEKVVPAMAAAMGQPVYDAKTHQGFGCGGCHAVDMK